MKPDLIAELHQKIERSRQVQEQSRAYRKHAEELSAQAERLFTQAEQAQQRLSDRIANNNANSRKSTGRFNIKRA